MLTSAHLRLHRRVRFPFRGLSKQSFSAGIAVLSVYLFAGLTIQVGILTQLGLSANEASSWFFITWLTTGLFSFILALVTKQPVSINLSIPVLVFLAGAAGGFSLPEILGANLVVGAVAAGLALFRLNDAFARLVPSQIAIGVLAGSMLAFIWKTAYLATTDLLVSGPVIAGFVLVLAVMRSQMLAVSAAAAVGFLGLALTGHAPGMGHSMALPQLSLPPIAFDLAAIVALGIPILILTVGVGNTQAVAVLRSEGYKVKGNLFGLAAGLATLVNALGGGHAAAIGGSSIVISAGPAAGPSASRFWSIIVSSLPVIAVAMLAVPVISVVQELPMSYTLTVGALTLTAPFRRVLAKTVDGSERAGGLTAFAVATLPFQAAGLPMAFWAFVAGVAVSATIRLKHIVPGWR